jgi:hypothetical protein
MAKGQRAKGQKGKRARVQVQKFASMWTKKKEVQKTKRVKRRFT